MHWLLPTLLLLQNFSQSDHLLAQRFEDTPGLLRYFFKFGINLFLPDNIFAQFSDQLSKRTVVVGNVDAFRLKIVDDSPALLLQLRAGDLLDLLELLKRTVLHQFSQQRRQLAVLLGQNHQIVHLDDFLSDPPQTFPLHQTQPRSGD